MLCLAALRRDAHEEASRSMREASSLYKHRPVLCNLVGDFLNLVLGAAGGVFDLALRLLCGALRLHVFVAGGLAGHFLHGAHALVGLALHAFVISHFSLLIGSTSV